MKPVIINLKDLRTGTYNFDIVLSSQDLELEDIEFKLNSTINTNIKIYKNRNNYQMSLSSSFKLLLVCSRCLSSFESEFNEKDEFYLKHKVKLLEDQKEEASSFSDEDAYTIFFQDEQIDIASLIREQVILAVPLKPLCSSNCQIPEYKGESEEIDLRWQKLRELINKI